MKKQLLLSFLFLSASLSLFAQTTDEAAVKKVIETETSSYYAGNYEGWANTWAHEPYILWAINSGEEGGYFKMLGWSELNGGMKETFEDRKTPLPVPKFARENYIVRQNGTMAFASFEQVQTNPDGSVRRSRESRVLEKQGGAWKLIYACVLDPKPEPTATAAGSSEVKKGIGPDFPKLTDAQKAETMAFLSTTVHAGSIAYAKSMGKSPKEYGQAIGQSFLPSWERAKPNALESVVEHMNRVAQGFNTPFELVNWSANEAVIKRGGLLQDPRMAGLFTSLGVTAQDMEAWNEGVMGEIAKGLGLSLSQRQEGEKVEVTVKKVP